MQDDPHLVGIGGTAGCPIALELAFVEFDQVLSLPAGAVERVVDIFGAATGQRGDDEANIEAERAGFDMDLRLR